MQFDKPDVIESSGPEYRLSTDDGSISSGTGDYAVIHKPSNILVSSHRERLGKWNDGLPRLAMASALEEIAKELRDRASWDPEEFQP